MLEALHAAREHRGRPTCIVANTVKEGRVLMEHTMSSWEGPTRDQLEVALTQWNGGQDRDQGSGVSGKGQSCASRLRTPCPWHPLIPTPDSRNLSKRCLNEVTLKSAAPRAKLCDALLELAAKPRRRRHRR